MSPIVTSVPFWRGAVDNGGGYACVGAGGIWEISVPFSQFDVNLKLQK